MAKPDARSQKPEESVLASGFWLLALVFDLILNLDSHA